MPSYMDVQKKKAGVVIDAVTNGVHHRQGHGLAAGELFDVEEEL